MMQKLPCGQHIYQHAIHAGWGAENKGLQPVHADGNFPKGKKCDKQGYLAGENKAFAGFEFLEELRMFRGRMLGIIH
jgi:hypothetical protein